MHGVTSFIYYRRHGAIKVLDSPLTPLLTHDADLTSSSTDFQISQSVLGASATATRYGSRYNVRMTLNGEKVKKVVAGIGSMQGYETIASFTLTESFPCEFQILAEDDNATTVQFEFELAFPCEGYTSENGAVYVVAPAAIIYTCLSESIVVMILEAAASSHCHPQVPESTMTVSHGDSSAALFLTGGDTVGGSLLVTGTGYDFVRVVAYRTPQIEFDVDNLGNPETRTDVQIQTLAEAKVAGEYSVQWVPVHSEWRPTVWLFALQSQSQYLRLPDIAISGLLGTLAKTLGGSFAEGYYPNFVFGEGRVTGHLLQLVMRPRSMFSGDKSRLAIIEMEH